jgi:hypothetical protein
MVWGDIYTNVKKIIVPSGAESFVPGMTGGTGGTGMTGAAGLTGMTGGTGAIGPKDPCTPAILSDINSQAVFNTWSSAQSTSINSPTATVATVTEVENTLTSYEKCLQYQITSLGTSATTIAQLQHAITKTNAEIVSAKNDVEIAKDRAKSVVHPERVSSYYESWFPINRPLKHYTIPLLIGTALVLLSVTFFLTLSLMGVNFNMRLPAMGFGNESFGTPFKIVAGLAVLFFALMLYAFLGRKSG